MIALCFLLNLLSTFLSPFAGVPGFQQFSFILFTARVELGC